MPLIINVKGATFHAHFAPKIQHIARHVLRASSWRKVPASRLAPMGPMKTLPTDFAMTATFHAPFAPKTQPSVNNATSPSASASTTTPV